MDTMTYREREASAQAAWAWIVGAAALVAVAWLIALSSYHPTQARVLSEMTAPQMVTQANAQIPPVSQPSSSVPLLNLPAAPSSQNVSGQAVVVRIVSDRGFWASAAGGQRVFVLLGPNAPPATLLHPGDLILLSATIQNAGSVNPNQATAADLQNLAVVSDYLQAFSVSLFPSKTGS